MRAPKKKQTGISLFIVMVIVLLTAIAVAMGFKSSQFNETVTGNTAEYQRAYEAAQALVHDAELDIMTQSATGSLCSGTNCREYGSIADADTDSGGKMYFPMPDDLSNVQAGLYLSKKSGGTGCISGICYPLLNSSNQPYAFWDDATVVANLKKRAAHYGQFTGGTYGSTSDKSNPRLNSSNSWYWVEILPYDASSGVFSGTELAPTDMNVIYRITALVEGTRNTRSVVQKIVVGKKASS
ncbi:MAG: hypothetical protein QM772_14975 [Ottowia sp.]|uniref:pilus assembly PilX family protein n=1 Tax=Ottowia sp. TaxID=1898956 RepID=UPI0039E2D2AC